MNVTGVLVSRDRTVYEWRGTRAKSLNFEIGRYAPDGPGWQAWCLDCTWYWGGGWRARDVVMDLRDHHRYYHKSPDQDQHNGSQQ